MISLFFTGTSMGLKQIFTHKLKGHIRAKRSLFWDLHRFDHERLRCMKRPVLRKYQRGFSFFFSMKHSLIPATKPAKPVRKFRCGRFILKKRARVDVTSVYK